MKKAISFKYAVYLIFVVSVTGMLQSCAVYNPYGNVPPVTVPDIVQMSKDGLPSKNIIRAIRKSQTVYWLKADQLANLRNEGVQDSVINYMEKTHLDAVSQNQRYRDSAYWYPGWDGYWYGGPAFGWPWGMGYLGFGWGPAIVFENRGFRGYYHGGGGYRSGGYHGGGGRRR